MGWLHDYEDVNRFASPRSVEQGTRRRGKSPGRFGGFNQASGIPSILSQEILQDAARSPRFSLRSPRSDPSILHDAGVPSRKTAALGNHDRSPRGPCRVNPHTMEEFVSSPRRQLQRGESCPPPRTDPITHTGSPRTDPLSLRQLEFGHLASRQRSLIKCGYTAQSATGKLDFKTHEQTSSELQTRARTASVALGFNSSALAGEEDILPSNFRLRASDKEVSARYTKVSNMQELTFIDRATIGGRKACNPSLLTSTDFFECLGQPGRSPQKEQPPSEQPSGPSSPRTSEVDQQRHLEIAGVSPGSKDHTGRKLASEKKAKNRTSTEFFETLGQTGRSAQKERPPSEQPSGPSSPRTSEVDQQRRFETAGAAPVPKDHAGRKPPSEKKAKNRTSTEFFETLGQSGRAPPKEQPPSEGPSGRSSPRTSEVDQQREQRYPIKEQREQRRPSGSTASDRSGRPQLKLFRDPLRA